LNPGQDTKLVDVALVICQSLHLRHCCEGSRVALPDSRLGLVEHADGRLVESPAGIDSLTLLFVDPVSDRGPGHVDRACHQRDSGELSSEGHTRRATRCTRNPGRSRAAGHGRENPRRLDRNRSPKNLLPVLGRKLHCRREGLRRRQQILTKRLRERLDLALILVEPFVPLPQLGRDALEQRKADLTQSHLHVIDERRRRSCETRLLGLGHIGDGLATESTLKLGQSLLHAQGIELAPALLAPVAHRGQDLSRELIDGPIHAANRLIDVTGRNGGLDSHCPRRRDRLTSHVPQILHASAGHRERLDHHGCHLNEVLGRAHRSAGIELHLPDQLVGLSDVRRVVSAACLCHEAGHRDLGLLHAAVELHQRLVGLLKAEIPGYHAAQPAKHAHARRRGGHGAIQRPHLPRHLDHHGRGLVVYQVPGDDVVCGRGVSHGSPSHTLWSHPRTAFVAVLAVRWRVRLRALQHLRQLDVHGRAATHRERQIPVPAHPVHVIGEIEPLPDQPPFGATIGASSFVGVVFGVCPAAVAAATHAFRSCSSRPLTSL
jgi:hypothetical protein